MSIVERRWCVRNRVELYGEEWEKENGNEKDAYDL